MNDLLSQIGVMIVVRATIIITVVYISEDSAPADTPTPATMSPTSPRDIIPIPTLNAFVLSFRNIMEGSPQPTIFVVTAMAITIPESTAHLDLHLLNQPDSNNSKEQWTKYYQ